MSIYNTDTWLREAVDSIISQTIGFKNNVQIIFVNDGSPDASEEICLEYRDKYPDNIVYVKKDNGGLASARNVGLNYVQGEYVNFFDPDDILSRDTLGSVYRYFNKHYDEIDLVAIKLLFFDAKHGDHGLNYKFEKDAIIDLEKQYDYAQLSAASSFIKESAIENIRFDDEIRYSEDVMFIPRVLSLKMKYGVLSKPAYYYRQRYAVSSITDSKEKNDYWFNVALPRVSMYLIDYSLKKYGKVLKFIQYIILYDIAGPVMGKLDTSVLSAHKLNAYKGTLDKLISYMDDDVIMRERNLTRTHKIYLIGKNHGEDSLKKLTVSKGSLIYRDQKVYKLNKYTVNVDLIGISNNNLVIEGYNNGIDIDDINICFSNNDEQSYRAEIISSRPNPLYYIDEVIYTKYRFRVSIPLEEINDIRPYVEVDGQRYYVKLTYRKNSRLVDLENSPYRTIDERIVLPLESSIIVQRKSLQKVIKRFTKRNLELIQSKKLNVVSRRILATVVGVFYKKPVWIISDRLVCGRDNGEALFRYISGIENSNIRTYFAVNRTSSDFKRLKKYGKVIDRQSYWYKILFLLSDKIISSHFDDFVTNPFGGDERHYSDMYKFKYVFLQHGVTINDMSPLLNKYKRDIGLLIAASSKERDEFLTDKYGYSQDEVKLTGFPRFDLLKNTPKNKIIIAPTWRRHIITKVKPGTDIREYDSSFKQTDYYKFYNDLINDKRITESLYKNNMTLEFFVHPNFSAQSKDFRSVGRVEVKSMPYDYTTAFTEGNILVTDYSSVAFDFAYMKKPVIYTQFDKDIFFKSHYAPGYFSYEKDGFGPVASSYEDSVRHLLKSIESGCKLEPKYIKRVESFYYKFDTKNSERAYSAILEMD